MGRTAEAGKRDGVKFEIGGRLNGEYRMIYEQGLTKYDLRSGILLVHGLYVRLFVRREHNG
jgi:hypothetical protein